MMKSRPALAVDRPEPSNSADKPFRVLSKESASEPEADAATDTVDSVDPLDAFSFEGTAAAKQTTVAAPSSIRANVRFERATALARANLRPWALGGVIAASAGLTVFGFVEYRAIAARSAAAEPGKLTIDSRPRGTTVIVDGTQRGVTPLTLTIPPGDHGLALLNGSDRRSLPITIAPGAEVSQYFEFAPSAPVVNTGKLSVTGDVAGSRVLIDGRSRGATPLLISDLPAGDHTVAVVGEGGTVERKVSIEPGTMASMVFSVPRNGAPAAGWLTLSAPFDVQLFENADLVGNGASARIMLPAGRHDIRVVNQSLGYEDSRRIEVAAGKTATVKIDAPKASLSANARPWADVFIDGTNVGQTPLANLSVPIGSHEVLFRNPQFGEQRQTVVVTTKGPNRVSADLTRK